jgi:hypothetical protein
MIEALLLSHLATAPQSLGLHGAAFRMRQAAGTVPLPSLRDLFELVKPERCGSQINPFLSSAATAQLRSMALLWLQLCVLEDKLHRLAAWVDDPAEAANLLQVGITFGFCSSAAVPGIAAHATCRATAALAICAGAVDASHLGPCCSSPVACV